MASQYVMHNQVATGNMMMEKNLQGTRVYLFAYK